MSLNDSLAGLVALSSDEGKARALAEDVRRCHDEAERQLREAYDQLAAAETALSGRVVPEPE